MAQFTLLFALVCALGYTLTATTAQSVDLPFKNFTSLSDALEDAEHFIEKQLIEAYKLPSLVFGLSVKGKAVLRKAWGQSDLENGVAAKLSTHYRIASISKTFTSVIVGTLVEKGLMGYDDPLSKYLDQDTFPGKQWAGKPVNLTIRQLLSNTAGTHVTDNYKDFNQVEVAQNVTQMLHRFKDEPVHFAPGSHFSYSNYGFQLVGAAIEKVTKQPFAQFVNDFLHQHGLNQSYAGNMSVLLHDIPRYYASFDVNDPKQNTPTAPYDDLLLVEGYWPSGGLLSTVDDMLHYGKLLLDSYQAKDKALLSRHTMQSMWRSHSEKVPFPVYLNSHYGLGWFVAEHNPKLKHQHIVWHSGGYLGATTMLIIYPDQEVVGVMLANKGGINALDQAIVYAVENVLHLLK